MAQAGLQGAAVKPRPLYLVRAQDSLHLLQESVSQLEAPEGGEQLPDSLLRLPSDVPGPTQEHGHQGPVVLPADTGTVLLGHVQSRVFYSQFPFLPPAPHPHRLLSSQVSGSHQGLPCSAQETG